MNAKRRAASLLLGVLLAACASTPANPPPSGSSAPAPSPIITTVPTATPAPTATALTASPIVAPTPAAVPLPGPTAAPTLSSCVTLNEYVVVTGDTLWDIAQRYGVTVEALLAGNPQIPDRRLIHAGDQITVPPPGWPAPLAPVADATIVDSDLDGAGDLVADGAVEVGFNHFYWPGELRGVYQFDLRGLPRDGRVASAHLEIRVNGTNTDGTDPHLTVFAGAGNGYPDKSDFNAGKLISTFDAFGSEGALCLDLTDTINRLRGDGADFITIVIRPNPLASTTTGTIGLSSSRSAEYGFQPARLALLTTENGVTFEVLLRNGSYSCEGGALAGYGVPGDGFAIINAASPRDLMAQVALRGGLPNTTYTVQLIQSSGLGGSIEDCSVQDATLVTDSRGDGYAMVREARLPDTIGAFVYLVHLGDATGPVDLHGTRLVPVARDS